MKVAILTAGTRGDVQPFVALGVGLKKAGHEVTVATGESFEALVAGHGLRFAPMGSELLALGEVDGRTALPSSVGDALRLARGLMPAMRRMLDESWEASRDAGAVVYHQKAFAGRHVAEALGVPAFACLTIPGLSPTRRFPNPALPFADLGGTLNRASYGAFLRLALAPYGRMLNRWREESLGLPPRRFLVDELELRGRPVRRLYCYSPRVVPDPPDWDESTTATGYWFLDPDDGWSPPQDLARFLEEGPPPVYVGFGSVSGRDPKRIVAAALAALRETGRRGVLAARREDLPLSGAPRDVFVVETAPHDWLFPRVAAVVHHGGAGTTGEGLRAGRPTVVCPLFGDQPFWGRRVRDLGVGPEPIPQRKLTAGKLARAIRLAVTSGAMRRRAEELGRGIRAERGVERAVGIIVGEAAPPGDAARSREAGTWAR